MPLNAAEIALRVELFYSTPDKMRGYCHKAVETSFLHADRNEIAVQLNIVQKKWAVLRLAAFRTLNVREAASRRNS